MSVAQSSSSFTSVSASPTSSSSAVSRSFIANSDALVIIGMTPPPSCGSDEAAGACLTTHPSPFSETLRLSDGLSYGIGSMSTTAATSIANICAAPPLPPPASFLHLSQSTFLFSPLPIFAEGDFCSATASTEGSGTGQLNRREESATNDTTTATTRATATRRHDEEDEEEEDEATVAYRGDHSVTQRPEQLARPTTTSGAAGVTAMIQVEQQPSPFFCSAAEAATDADDDESWTRSAEEEALKYRDPNLHLVEEESCSAWTQSATSTPGAPLHLFRMRGHSDLAAPRADTLPFESASSSSLSSEAEMEAAGTACVLHWCCAPHWRAVHRMERSAQPPGAEVMHECFFLLPGGSAASAAAPAQDTGAVEECEFCRLQRPPGYTADASSAADTDDEDQEREAAVMVARGRHHHRHRHDSPSGDRAGMSESRSRFESRWRKLEEIAEEAVLYAAEQFSNFY